MTLACVYTVGERTRLELHEADVFSVPADALVLGRCPTVRSRAEAVAGRSFDSPITRPGIGWPCATLSSRTLPWPLAISVAYRPRSRDPFAPFTMPRLPHVARLARALQLLLFSVRHELVMRDVAIMPLSWRNPEVVACATISAIRCLATPPDGLRTIKIVTHDSTAVFQKWLEEPAFLSWAARHSAVPMGGDVSIVLHS